MCSVVQVMKGNNMWAYTQTVIPSLKLNELQSIASSSIDRQCSYNAFAIVFHTIHILDILKGMYFFWNSIQSLLTLFPK